MKQLLTFWSAGRIVPVGLFLLISTGSALGQTSDARPRADTLKTQRLGDVEVTGGAIPVSKTELSTEATASPASVTLVGRDYVARQAVNSYGDLLRPLAGVTVANFQLGGVGYGVSMRGYVVTEHARDILFLIDGVPQNQGSNIQTNGYVDLNPLIPETLRRIEVTKGPFSPFYGDHALGGTIRFDTEDRLASSVSLTGGTYGFVRAVAIAALGSQDRTRGGGYVALEENRSDGYRDNGHDQRLNGLAKYSFPMAGGMGAVRVQAFSSQFGSANYLIQSDVESGRTNRRAALDPTDGGSTQQQNAVFTYRGDNAAHYWTATAYVQHHDFVRFRVGQNGSTRALTPQRKEEGNQTWAGFDLRRTVVSTLAGVPVEVAAGVSFRGDDIDNTRFRTVGRVEQAQVQARRVRTYTPAVYGLFQLKPTERLKLTLGARYDQLYYNITSEALDSDYPNKDLQPHPGVFSPKVGLAYSVSSAVSVFANAARGFKAPSGYEENIDNPELGVSRLNTYEVGIAGDDASGRLHGLLAAYRTDQTGEIQNDPVSGALINYGKTLRQGIEGEGRYRFGANPGSLGVFANYSVLQAELRNGEPGTHYVLNAPKYTGAVGLDFTAGAASNAANQVTLSVYDQLVGPKRLNDDGSLESRAFQRMSGKLIFTRPAAYPGFRVFLETTFYPDGSHGLDEMSFVTGGVLRTAPQAKATFSAGVKLPF